jgi:DNA-binding transcriptional LysR family regulator
VEYLSEEPLRRLRARSWGEAELQSQVGRQSHFYFTEKHVTVLGRLFRKSRDLRRQCDLALGIGSASMVPNGLKVEVLCRQRFVCLISSDIRRPAKRFSLDDYLSRPHAVVDTAGRQQMMVDRPIAELGKSRSVAFQSPYFLPTALNVVGTDLVLTVPGGVAATLCHLTGLRQVLPPKEIGDFAYVMAWHPRINADAGHTWFREQIKAAACRRKNKT